MRDEDLLKICLEYIDHLDEKKQKFIRDIRDRRRRNRKYRLNPAQHKYLQDCYDLAVARKFGLEETFQPDKEHFKILAIKKAKRRAL